MRRLRNLCPLALVASGLLACASSPGPSSSKIDLFNGRDLTGWRAIGDARWTVENGELVGEVGGGHQSFLVTEGEYSDFVLELELQCSSGNSGVQVRSHQRPNGQVFGYQIEVDPSERSWSGGLYDEGRRGWLFDLHNRPEARAAFHRDDWNRYRIELIGQHIRTWVNGVPVVDTTDAEDTAGFIGLQVHSGSDTRVRWRGIVVRELKTSDRR